ncbi:hypothetical protein AGMMS50239_13950 [Bacteroidia bacterium]|nr:hypothetical protein AGMMS50239_13950 [Bacteroidia bacterium]
MKYIIFSFDDGRKDNYEVAYHLLQKYGFTASFHIITGLVDGTMDKHVNEYFSSTEGMSVDNVMEMCQQGFDISSHGDKHLNEENDLYTSLLKLRSWNLSIVNYNLFSSPCSEIRLKNIHHYASMLHKNNIKFVRSGNPVRTNGLIYIGLYVLMQLLKSKRLFYFLSKRNVMQVNKFCTNSDIPDINIIKATGVKCWHTIGMLKYFIKRLLDGQVAVFMFHGIMPENEKKNSWVFSAEKFERLLIFLNNEPNTKIININEYINIVNS